MPARPPTEIFAITGPDWSPIVETVEGRFVEASNATMLGTTIEGESVIYKPVAGVRPLWDFEAATLAEREVWAYRFDRELGLGLVPETTMAEGPFGPGAVQRYVDGVANQAVVDLVNQRDASLWPIALLDLVVNNADRKAGHILQGPESQLWAIDHGLTFHSEDKLRTVLWGFAGRPIPAELLSRLPRLVTALNGSFGEELAAALSEAELDAAQDRVMRLIETGRHPEPPHDRPAIPWPPY